MKMVRQREIDREGGKRERERENHFLNILHVHTCAVGIMLHYATPALKHLYFIDPQWLCDMLAHVVTVPEVNRFIQRGSGQQHTVHVHTYIHTYMSTYMYVHL